MSLRDILPSPRLPLPAPSPPAPPSAPPASAPAPDFTSLARTGANASRVVHASHGAVVERSRDGALMLALVRPGADAAAATAARTRAALEPIVSGAARAALPGSFRGRGEARGVQFVRYTAAGGGGGGEGEKVLRVMQAPVDPMEPPRFKQKKAPAGAGSPPVPVLHSPERPLSRAERADWVVPPAISNWKNNRGYTVPLDKRLASGGGAGEGGINDRFAGLAEAMYGAERSAREDVERRAVVMRGVSAKKKEVQEKQLRELAAKARAERAGFEDGDSLASGVVSGNAGGGGGQGAVWGGDGRAGRQPTAVLQDESGRGESVTRPPISKWSSPSDKVTASKADDADVERRDAMREHARRTRERQMRLNDRPDDDEPAGPSMKRSRLSRDHDRDFSERVALGQAGKPGAGTGEVAYDQRLFNQGGEARGLRPGFGGQDADTLYDKPLFAATQATTVYRPKADSGYDDEDEDAGVSRAGPEKVLGGGGGGLSRHGPRTGPVEFERDEGGGAAPEPSAKTADPFGLDEFLNKVS